MNFQNLSKILTSDEYLDLAFSKARKRAEIAGQKKFKEHYKKMRHMDSVRVSAIGGSLEKSLSKITESFPSVEHLPDFYKEMIKATLDYGYLRKSLAGVNWIRKKVGSFSSLYSSKIMKCQHKRKINEYRKEYYGRISSLMRQIKKELQYLEEARKVMRKFPSIKSSIYTVSICGFPNIGKTTLLSKLTEADPEISDYSFTTKAINVGYIYSKNRRKVQLLDTPGTLNRFNKMNSIEKQAYIAMKHASNMYVYVFDLTEPYELKDQLKLYEALKEHGKDIIIYVSKSDILPQEALDSFMFECTADAEKLKKELIDIADSADTEQ